jgi:hypothetical protein
MVNRDTCRVNRNVTLRILRIESETTLRYHAADQMDTPEAKDAVTEVFAGISLKQRMISARGTK